MEESCFPECQQLSSPALIFDCATTGLASSLGLALSAWGSSPPCSSSLPFLPRPLPTPCSAFRDWLPVFLPLFPANLSAPVFPAARTPGVASYLLLPQPSPGPGRVFSALLVSHVVSALSAPPLEGTHRVLPVAAPPQGVESQREDTWHGTGLGQGSSASGHIWGWVVLRRGEGLSHTLLDVEQHPRRLLTKTPVALPSPSCVNQKCLQTLAGVSRGAAFLLVENCWVRR